MYGYIKQRNKVINKCTNTSASFALFWAGLMFIRRICLSRPQKNKTSYSFIDYSFVFRRSNQERPKMNESDRVSLYSRKKQKLSIETRD